MEKVLDSSEVPDTDEAEGRTISKKKILVTVVLLAFCSAGGYFAYLNFMFVTTDNAQVQAHTVMLSPKVSGVVTRVTVRENDKVKAGQLLVKLDDRDYWNRLRQAEGELASVQARFRDAEKNYRRMAGLLKASAVSQSQFDSAEATYKEQSSKIASLQAQLDQAKLNLDYTEMKAPADGIIARKSAEVGMLANIGQPLVGFVESNERWVSANFKETELRYIKIGKKAEITVDAIPSRKFDGEVESLSPTTGSTFTLLPPDNSTGNFTKVVQRVPVRIKMLNLTEQDIEALQAGLSADVSIPVH